MADEQRVDGQHLHTPREPGSDGLLSDEARQRIAEAIQYIGRLRDSRATPDDLRSR